MGSAVTVKIVCNSITPYNSFENENRKDEQQMRSVESADGDVLRAAIEFYGVESQLKMLLEEMSELQKEVCKYWRGGDNLAHLAEEIADVEIMLDQTKMIFDLNASVFWHRKAKLMRLEERIRAETDMNGGGGDDDVD